MYEILSTKKLQKMIDSLIRSRGDIKDKLDRLKENPYNAIGAHPLKGKLKGKWACWLGSNLRMIYVIEEKKKVISIDAIGTHNIY